MGKGVTRHEPGSCFCDHLLQLDPGQQLRSRAVFGHLPVFGRFQKAGLLGRHGPGRHLCPWCWPRPSPSRCRSSCSTPMTWAICRPSSSSWSSPCSCSSSRITLKKYCPGPVHGAGRLPAAHHHQLLRAGRDHPGRAGLFLGRRAAGLRPRVCPGACVRRGRGRRLSGGHAAVLRRAPARRSGRPARELQGPAHHAGGRGHHLGELYGLSGVWSKTSSARCCKEGGLAL